MTGRTADGRIETVRIVPDGHAGRELWFRCHAGAAGDGVDHRARRARARTARRYRPHFPNEPRARPNKGSKPMQSAWIDRDAEAAVARYAGPRPRSGAAGLYHASAGPGSAPGAARRRQHLGEDAACRSQRRRCRRALRQGLRLGHGRNRARGPAGGAACAAAETARPRKAFRRGNGAAAARQSDRPDGAESVGRGAAARLHPAQIRRPHPFDGGARAHRPARWRSIMPRGFWRAGGLCALHHAGLRSGQSRGAGVRCGSLGRRPDPRQARHLQLRRRGTASL